MLVLASASKARAKLLDQFSIDYRILVSDIDESKYSSTNAVELVQMLSEKKASSIVSKISSEKYRDEYIDAIAVLGCDSLFEFEGEIFGKPKSMKEAIERWRRMSGSSGLLHTGHSLFVRPKDKSNSGNEWGDFICKDVVSTSISFSFLTEKNIVRYVESGEPLKCAGGFAIEGKGGIFISKIVGCYSNVIGLSLPWLKNNLERFEVLDDLMKPGVSSFL